MKILESAENYLESILILQNEHGYVRSVDIANRLNFTKASVSVAMKALRNEKYIDVSDEGHILLTEKGREIAESMYERHEIIAKGLIALGVDKTTAYEDSCKIEHRISAQSFEKIKEHLIAHKIIEK